MYSPKRLLLRSQLYILGELLQKQAAEAKTNGVVGNMGSTVPIAPKDRQIMPAANHNPRMIFCPFFLYTLVSEGFSSFKVQHPSLISLSVSLKTMCWFDILSEYSLRSGAFLDMGFAFRGCNFNPTRFDCHSFCYSVAFLFISDKLAGWDACTTYMQPYFKHCCNKLNPDGQHYTNMCLRLCIGVHQLCRTSYWKVNSNFEIWLFVKYNESQHIWHKRSAGKQSN